MAGAGVPALYRRPVDLIFVVFFAFNLVFISYTLDIEQLVIADPHHFSYPWWPPRAFVDAAHWYGDTYDPLVMARPAFWRMMMWIDAVYFGPFYLAAIVAFVRGRDWIRVPALVWSGMLITCVSIILMEERYGQWPTDHLPVVLATNVPWLLVALAMIWRMRADRPFGRLVRPVPQEVEGERVDTDPGSGRPVLDRGVR